MVRYNRTERKLESLEKVFSCLCMAPCFGGGCWIQGLPKGCAKDKDMECVRGEQYQLFRLPCVMGIVIQLVVAMYVMIVVYLQVRKLEYTVLYTGPFFRACATTCARPMDDPFVSEVGLCVLAFAACYAALVAHGGLVGIKIFSRDSRSNMSRIKGRWSTERPRTNQRALVAMMRRRRQSMSWMRWKKTKRILRCPSRPSCPTGRKCWSSYRPNCIRTSSLGSTSILNVLDNPCRGNQKGIDKDALGCLAC